MGTRADTIYDVGMHKGEDSEYYLKKGFRVIAFEADANLAGECRKAFASQIASQQLTIVEGAIIDPSELPPGQREVPFYRNKNLSVWGTARADWADRNAFLGTESEVGSVTAVDFRACLQRYGIPHYMKIDIEGSDLICLRALLDFPDKPHYVSIESELSDFRKLEAEFDILEQLGYSGFKAVQQQNIDHQVPPAGPSAEGRYVPHRFREGASGLFGTELAGEWQTRDSILRQYRRIFKLYRLFGNYSMLRRSMVGRRFIQLLGFVAGRPIPGWYDTHARHSSTPAVATRT